MKSVNIVGGGAAGYFAAIHIKLWRPDFEVTIHEATSRPLSKVKVSGGGRCNLTHYCFDTDTFSQNYPRGERFLSKALKHFQARDTMAWFERHGANLKVESDNRVFPVSNDSQTIVDCLRQETQRLGIKEVLSSRIVNIEQADHAYVLTDKNQTQYHCEKVVVTTGSSEACFKMLEDMGITLKDRVPSLFTFKIDDPRLKPLPGVSFIQIKGQLKTEGMKKPISFSGPALITHWGLSGPMILKLSAWGAKSLFDQGYKGILTLNFSPNMNHDQLIAYFLEQKVKHPKLKIKNMQTEAFPKRYYHNVLEYLQIPHDRSLEEVSHKDLRKLVNEVTAACFEVQGKGVFKDEFVTCGGVSLQKVNPLTMESKEMPGLYFAGEVLDVDGITGGFNLQNTWTTGYLAAKGVVQKFT